MSATPNGSRSSTASTTSPNSTSSWARRDPATRSWRAGSRSNPGSTCAAAPPVIPISCRWDASSQRPPLEAPTCGCSSPDGCFPRPCRAAGCPSGATPSTPTTCANCGSTVRTSRRCAAGYSSTSPAHCWFEPSEDRRRAHRGNADVLRQWHRPRRAPLGRSAHDRLVLEGGRWGWHDMAVRLRGPAAQKVWDIFRERWQETLTLPHEHWLASPTDRRRLNPPGPLAAPAPAPTAAPVEGSAVRGARASVDVPPQGGFASAVPPPRLGSGARGRAPGDLHDADTAIGAARRYIYLEDQYLEESVGGNERFELYPHLCAAAARGVKVILVGSGTRDPEDIDFGGLEINRELNADLQTKLVTRSGRPPGRMSPCTASRAAPSTRSCS